MDISLRTQTYFRLSLVAPNQYTREVQNRISIYLDHQVQVFCEGLSHRVLHFLNRIIDCCSVAERANILPPQNLVVGRGPALPPMTFHRLSKLNLESLYSRSKIDSFVTLASQGQQGVYFRTHCYCSTCKH